MAIGATAKFITFDCYGTLINFEMTKAIKETFGARLPADQARAFISLASTYRFDEALGDWKPYRQIIKDATRRAARFAGIATRTGIGCTRRSARGVRSPMSPWPCGHSRPATRS